MTTFLLLISLIVNSIAIFAIIILYLRQNRLVDVEKKQEKMIHDMEESISAYLIQMKEENENFIKRIKEINAKPIVQENMLPVSKTTEEKNRQDQQIDSIKMDLPIAKNIGKKQQAVKAYKNTPKPVNLKEDINEDVILPPLTEKEDEQEAKDATPVEDLYMDSLYNQVVMMKKQGLSEDEIAKKLNKGKTEVELLLKFRQK